MAKSITENFWFYVTDRLYLLLCKMEILNTLSVQNRCMQEAGMSSDTENSCNLVLKGKGLWKFLLYNQKKKEIRCFVAKPRLSTFHKKKKN